VVVVSPLLTLGELLTVVPSPLSTGPPLLPIRAGVVPLVVSGDAVVSVSDDDFLQLSALGS
jgi:hypothetical protein